ncbi:MAG: CDC48 family AAA ATPase [Crenarchaeota archaeon]|nr:CDC48 family AAA ATPase [Thermoproteota archaeon]MCR8455055.1 CDC48 family AAA ATPase [Thermoproteota archaeon]MCR8501039.1 CDC48 family AAA ATPase [Thermoproteota archaeon]
MSEKKHVKLLVLDSLARDVARWRIRTSKIVMNELGVSTGEVVIIKGPRGTAAAYVWPDREIPEGNPYYVKMDQYLRENVGVKIGGYVLVSRIPNYPPPSAIRIELAPKTTGMVLKYVSINPDEVKMMLNDAPLLEGNLVYLEILGKKVPFAVTNTEPKGVVIITESTQIEIISEAPSQMRLKLVRYEDIGGLDYAIEKVRELIELPLKHPELFERLNLDPPKGILFHGPPGTGKTLLARAIANETDAYFISISGPAIVSKFYGESEERLRRIFDEARKNAPAIIFIDEIDAIAPRRSEVIGEVEKRIVSQLLALMDGLQPRENVIVIAATNRIDAIDPALRRPGRFDREIEFRVPDEQGRYEILKIHTRGTPLADDVDLKKVAHETYGFVGADLAALVREAAMHSLRRFIREHNIDIKSPEPIPQELLKKLEIKIEDFRNAMKEVRPSALREVLVEIPSIKWDDIGGLDHVKQALKEMVEWPLKYPDVFERMGIDPPKGILLYGPPGCGKTLLAKAVATESRANFIGIRGPELLSKWYGESERRIREVFTKARQVAPAVIFFDEIDSIAPRRGLYAGDSGATERVIAQLLTEMDGLIGRREVFIIAATNRPDLLDPALLRPGRIDRLLYVPPPDFNARLDIFKVHTRGMPLADDVDLVELAKKTKGFSGADIEALCREAAMTALRRSNLEVTKVTKSDFEIALARSRPSITPELINYYTEFERTMRKQAVQVIGGTESYELT